MDDTRLMANVQGKIYIA